MRMNIPLRSWLGLALGLVILIGCTASAPQTEEPPTVDICEPSSGSSLSGIVLIRESATDDGRVAEVRLYVDDQLISVDTTNPFEFAWDTSTVSNGDHRISAIAKDDDGQEAEITAPPADSTVSGSSVAIVAAASDDVAVAGVEFFLDGASLGSDDGSPFSLV
jgi:thermitase